MNNITMTLQVDHLIMEALREDISSEDVTTNAVMKEAVTGEVQLICKQDGVVAGLDVFHRVFEILDENIILFHLKQYFVLCFFLNTLAFLAISFQFHHHHKFRRL